MSTLELLASSLTKMNSLVRKYCGDKLELADVEKDEIRTVLRSDREAFDAIGRLEDFDIEGLEGLLDDDADGLRIVHGQNFVAHGMSGEITRLFG